MNAINLASESQLTCCLNHDDMQTTFLITNGNLVVAPAVGVIHNSCLLQHALFVAFNGKF